MREKEEGRECEGGERSKGESGGGKKGNRMREGERGWC